MDSASFRRCAAGSICSSPETPGRIGSASTPSDRLRTGPSIKDQIDDFRALASSTSRYRVGRHIRRDACLPRHSCRGTVGRADPSQRRPQVQPSSARPFACEDRRKRTAAQRNRCECRQLWLIRIRAPAAGGQTREWRSKPACRQASRNLRRLARFCTGGQVRSAFPGSAAGRGRARLHDMAV
jgi:hypothetical protein